MYLNFFIYSIVIIFSFIIYETHYLLGMEKFIVVRKPLNFKSKKFINRYKSTKQHNKRKKVLICFKKYITFKK